MNEIGGILNNAFAKGWPIDEIRQSLLNAGYEIDDIETSLREFSQKPVPIIPQEPKPVKFLSKYQSLPSGKNKKLTWILISSLTIVLLLIIGLVIFLIKT